MERGRSKKCMGWAKAKENRITYRSRQMLSVPCLNVPEKWSTLICTTRISGDTRTNGMDQN